jgi:hypothetical protein
MRNNARQTRENRTITGDFQNEATSVQLLADGKACVELVMAFILALGVQLKHQATCGGGGWMTRYSHDIRVRLHGVPLWRIQCTTCRAVFTVLPHVVWRDRAMRSDAVNTALFARHGGRSWALGAVICHLSPMAIDRLVCALGHQSLITGLTRCGLPLPAYFLADEQYRPGLADNVDLPTMVSGRVIWHLGYTEEARAAALTPSDGEFQCAASHQEPSYRVRGIRTDGVESTIKRRRTLFPEARLGHCLLQAVNKLPGKLTAVASSVRKACRSRLHLLFHRGRQRKG